MTAEKWAAIALTAAALALVTQNSFGVRAGALAMLIAALALMVA